MLKSVQLSISKGRAGSEEGAGPQYHNNNPISPDVYPRSVYPRVDNRQPSEVILLVDLSTSYRHAGNGRRITGSPSIGLIEQVYNKFTTSL